MTGETQMKKVVLALLAVVLNQVAPALAEEKPDLKNLVYYTKFEVWNQEESVVKTKRGWSHNWDEVVVYKATLWANTTEPNIAVTVGLKDKKFVMVKIMSYADPWGSGGTHMHLVAKRFEGMEATGENLNALTKKMKDAYHLQFGQ